MAHQFCIHCGFKLVYDSSPPKFCSSCGEPFGRASKPKKTVVEDDDEEDDEDESEGHFDTKRLSKDWGASLDFAPRLTFGELYTNPAPREELGPRPESDKGLAGKALLKNIETQCGKVKSSREIG